MLKYGTKSMDIRLYFHKDPNPRAQTLKVERVWGLGFGVLFCRSLTTAIWHFLLRWLGFILKLFKVTMLHMRVPQN